MFDILRFIILQNKKAIPAEPKPWDDVPNSEVGTMKITDVSLQLKLIEFKQGYDGAETGTMEIKDISITLTAV